MSNSQTNPNLTILTPAEQKRLQTLEKRYRSSARITFEKRVAYYPQFTGGEYHTITIRDQKSRWGSCSSRGTLSFNYRLIFAPPGVLDYVVVHELCHFLEANHSDRFWREVERVLPDWRERERLGKSN